FTAPWRVALVCKSWRKCALSDPLLWSTIRVWCWETPAAKVVERFPLVALETQLMRSGHAPLDIEFITFYRRTPAEPAVLNLFKALARESHRSEQFRFLCIEPHPEIVPPEILAILAQIRGQTKLLRSLEFNSAPLPTQFNDMFILSPQLQKVFLAFSNLMGPSSEFSVPWEQVTHLQAHFPTRLWAEILCRNEILDTPNFILPQLRRLSMRNSVSFLEFLETPQLEYLFLGHFAPSIPAFLQRSQFVTIIPTLLHLHAYLIDADSTTQLFQELKNRCSQLTSIHLAVDNTPCDYEALCDFIAAHKNTLKFASICTNSPPPAAKEKLLALRGDLLDLVVFDLDDESVDIEAVPLAHVTKDMEPM
ncbi:hypothetical protein B0H16DRAFT_1782313, partial [Mycena metata]